VNLLQEQSYRSNCRISASLKGPLLVLYCSLQIGSNQQTFGYQPTCCSEQLNLFYGGSLHC